MASFTSGDGESDGSDNVRDSSSSYPAPTPELITELMNQRSGARLDSDNRTEFGSFRSLNMSDSRLQQVRTDNNAASQEKDKSPVSAQRLRNGTANASSSGNEPAKKGLSPADFWMGELIGEGAFARVHICALKMTGDQYAIKIMEKRFIQKAKKINLIKMEKRVLTKVRYDSIVQLHFSFTDDRHLYMVLDLCRGGELTQVIDHYKTLNEDKGISDRACTVSDCRFYLAETLLAVQYLHFHGIVHRDLKPQNILLSGKGHVKITDFGTALDESMPIKDQDAFVGTAQYVSPEVLDDGDVSVGADLWAIGVILFQMIVGESPFIAESEYLIFENINNHHEEDRIHLPRCTEELHEAENLINSLLKPDPTKRLGASNNCTRVRKKVFNAEINKPSELRAHTFFKGLDMRHLTESEAPALPYNINIPQPTLDGADSDWMLQGDATELLEAAFCGENAESSGSQPQKSELVGEFDSYLKEGEKIILEGLVKKRAGVFDKNRHLILTSKPRLLYFSPSTLQLKGEIDITHKLMVVTKSRKKFEVVTDKRTYYFTDYLGSSERWKKTIEGLQTNALSSLELHE
uniref:non-specific serine/threonine protein kinase n=1 Tax=Aplanochytrium stocchinoi TaxID=215587 RepID=A0A6S8C6P2_9STRA|eukprot:CAMPEP_0204826482 /NCGR_PEP_ID=MMETSP1346-20131115/4161_1 /ASSEMBLY_ACC=CAM_ASM_000771 /TAXON_ID=215587 /ORGANISM="Aplanochytrium stocchinoi, Strain GSBS06" /LENGTH=577 /DNA_ID=CAMNT_0051954527 /DNA_START=134 /DNA_END=1867 /DNA_ORIENTATION=-